MMSPFHPSDHPPPYQIGQKTSPIDIAKLYWLLSAKLPTTDENQTYTRSYESLMFEYPPLPHSYLHILLYKTEEAAIVFA